MKTEAICITTMGKEHVELVDVFPKECLTNEQKEFIQKNSLPIGANKGDYFTIEMDNHGNVLFSYVFVIPSLEENDRNIIASLTSIVREHEKILVDKIHEESEIHKEFVRKSFSYIIDELQKLGILSLPTIIEIIPAILDGLMSGNFKIEVNGRRVIEFSFGIRKSAVEDDDEITRKTMMSELY
ncbi:MAG: hypothetical protein HZR80_19440 [Candidatus Heimdallarchaeota archaeon]